MAAGIGCGGTAERPQAGPDGEPVPVYEEVSKTGAEFAKAGSILSGTQPVSEVAVIHDYDSRWAIEFNPFSSRYDQMQILIDYYRNLRETTQAVDIVTPEMEYVAIRENQRIEAISDARLRAQQPLRHHRGARARLLHRDAAQRVPQHPLHPRGLQPLRHHRGRGRGGTDRRR